MLVVMAAVLTVLDIRRAVIKTVLYLVCMWRHAWLLPALNSQARCMPVHCTLGYNTQLNVAN